MQPMPASTPQGTTDGREHDSLASRVRSNAGSAGLGAACLLFFGFWHLSPGNGTDLLNLSWSLAYHTFRIGGVVLGLVALGCLSGAPVLLLLDAAVSIPIGASLLICAVTRLGSSSLEAFIFVIAGIMFLRSGWFYAGMYTAWRRSLSDGAANHEGRPTARQMERSPARIEPTPAGRSESLASRLLNEARAERGQPSPPDSRTPTGLEARPPAGRLEDPASAVDSRSEPIDASAAKHGPASDSTASPPTTVSPPEGFLAAMARKHRDEK